MIDNRLNELREMERRVASMLAGASDDTALKGGGGDGTSGGMDERVIRLEGDVSRLKDDVSQLRVDSGTLKVDVATIKENIRHLPTKPWMFSTLAAMLAALAIVVGLIVRFLPHAG